MNRYTVNHAYRSRRDGQDFGPWSKGDEAELSEADAEWVERDSPGTLSPIGTEVPEEDEADSGETAEAERQAPKTPNRQHKGGRNRGAA